MKQTERGWGGHFICAERCLFRRNTLIEHKDIKVVVSTVGLMRDPSSQKFETIGIDRYYETMVFHADKEDTRYHDADVGNEIYWDGPWSINEIDADDRANDMHEKAVKTIKRMIKKGEIT